MKFYRNHSYVSHNLDQILLYKFDDNKEFLFEPNKEHYDVYRHFIKGE